MKRLITSAIILFFILGCQYNINLVNGTKNETGVDAPMEKNIPITTEGTIPASVVGGL